MTEHYFPCGHKMVLGHTCPVCVNADLVAALEGALPYLRHSLKFYRFQREGHEFWPNREEAEANIRDAEAALAKAKS